MSVKVNLAKSGMGIEEGTIARWLKAVGEKVQKGEILVEVETAKAIQEIEAPASGTLRIIKEPGEIYQVGTIIGEIG